MNKFQKVYETENLIVIFTGLLEPGECGPIIDISKFSFTPSNVGILARTGFGLVKIEASHDGTTFNDNIADALFFRLINIGSGSVEKTCWTLNRFPRRKW